MNNELQRIAELLRDGRRVLFITGAGVSAETGIPTFRGATGAFADGLTEEGVPFEELLSGESFEGMAPLPPCPKCGHVLRPDAVLYEEMLPESALDLSEREQDKGFDLIFSVGTSSVFEYVAHPVIMAARRGIPTVEINPEPTPLSDVVGFRFAAPAGGVLQSIVAGVRGPTFDPD
jgi:NAD-dependent SIR2 family protein deacetylase